MKDDARREFIHASPSAISLAPLDLAIEYLRSNWPTLLLPYAIAMAPFTLVVYFLIDALTVGYRSFLYAAALYLSLAYIWRWGALAVMQKKINEDLGGKKVSFRAVVPDAILVRLIGGVAFTWGSLILIPPFYALFVGGMAPALLAEEEGTVFEKLAVGFKWTQKLWRRLAKMAGAITLVFLTLLVAVLILQFIVEGSILGGILDLDTTHMKMTMNSVAWILSLMYFLFLCFDFYWTIAVIFVFYDLRRRRLGGDLRVRIEELSEEKP